MRGDGGWEGCRRKGRGNGEGLGMRDEVWEVVDVVRRGERNGEMLGCGVKWVMY